MTYLKPLRCAPRLGREAWHPSGRPCSAHTSPTYCDAMNCTYLFGPRLTLWSGRFSWYAQFNISSIQFNSLYSLYSFHFISIHLISPHAIPRLT